MLFPFSLIRSTCGPDLQWTVWALGCGACAVTHWLPSLLWLLVLRHGGRRVKRQSSETCWPPSMSHPDFSDALTSHGFPLWGVYPNACLFMWLCGLLEDPQKTCMYIYSGPVWGIQIRLYISFFPLPLLAKQWEHSLPAPFLLPLCLVPMASYSLWDKRQSSVPWWREVSGLWSL